MKIELLGNLPFDIDWQRNTYDCKQCYECPFCDDSSGFYWCTWMHIRVQGTGKPKECIVHKVEVETKKHE